MTHAEAKSLADGLMQSAKQNLINDGELMPIVVLCCPSGAKLIGLQFRTADEKRQAYAAIEKLIAMESPEFIISLTDSWYKTKDADCGFSQAELDQIARSGGVKAQPDRQEAIMMLLMTREGTDSMRFQLYHHELDTIVFDDYPDWESGGMLQNNLVRIPDSWRGKVAVQ